MTLRILALLLVLLPACSSTRNLQETESKFILAEAYIAASYDDVWDSFTTADAYENWASTPCVEFASEVGGPIRWSINDRLTYRGTLLEITKGAGLRHTFQFVGFGFEEQPTTVDIKIQERGETVLVTIRHDCSGSPRSFEMISPVGWSKSLSRLKTLLETGTAMPWPTVDDPADSASR